MKRIKNTLTSPGLWLKKHTRMHIVIAILVFAIGIGATIYYWNNLRISVNTDMQAAYKRQMSEITSTAASRLILYENFLRGSAGLFKIKTALTQAQWEEFHKPFNIGRIYPDIEGVGASRYINNPDLLQAFLGVRRQEDPSYTIYPAGDRSVYVPVSFNAIYTGNNGTSRGYDSYTDPPRRAAMDRAISTGQPTMSGILKLANEARPSRNAFILYMPIFADGAPLATSEQRQAGIMGFTYIAIDGKTLIDEMLAESHATSVGLTMTDAEQGSGLFYQSANYSAIRSKAGSFTDSHDVMLYGHKWHLNFAAAPELLPARERQLPQQALWRGIVTCAFFAALVWYLITDRERKYARQKQEEVQTAKDDLLSLASHQLRTPATVVKQYVGMLMQGYAGKLTDQQTNMLENAYESNEHQLEIINQLLYVARLDADRIKLRTEKTDVAKLMRNVARDQSQTVAERNLQLTFRLPGQELWAEVDPHYLRMVFDNLLSNAVKYTPDGGTITLSVRRAHGHIVIKVADTGVGIDSSLQSTVFEKFTRVENALSNDVNGSGVGLYLTQKIVQLHHGSIDVKSAVGKGSTFTVRIPTRLPK
ncbi:MAG TPA: CHASE domain-containing protein [Candidatus Saccharimonadales bacterium]